MKNDADPGKSMHGNGDEPRLDPPNAMSALTLLTSPRAASPAREASDGPADEPPTSSVHVGRTVPSDFDILRALESGDTRAAAWLYDRLRPSIDFTLRRVLHARHRDFDDLMQTSFERILRALAEGRFQGRSSLSTWASAIAGHVALDALRASYREKQRLAAGVVLDEIALPARSENKLEALTELRRVQGVLTRMKPDLAETLILADVLGYSLEEMASLRGASLSATQSRLHRARLELRRRAGAPVPSGSKGASS